MMIDETIKGLEKASDYLLNAVGGYPLNEAEEKMINSVDYAIEFIEWYLSQDLVKREDVLRVSNLDLCLDFDREMCAKTPNCRCCNIMRIPKPEPPKGE